MSKKSVWRRLYEWNPNRPGGFTDPSTVRGRWRFLGVSIISTYIMWYFHEIYGWIETSLGFQASPINPGDQAWSRVWAVIIGGGGAFGAFLAIFVISPIERYRARKSAKGQWFDRPDLTKEDLYGDSPDDLPCDFPKPNPQQQPEHDL